MNTRKAFPIDKIGIEDRKISPLKFKDAIKIVTKTNVNIREVKLFTTLPASIDILDRQEEFRKQGGWIGGTEE